MLISSKKLTGLKAETKSGIRLGRVKSFEMETDGLELKKVYVRPANLIKGLVDGDLVIEKHQIIYLDDKKMVVKDLLEGELVKGRALPASLMA